MVIVEPIVLIVFYDNISAILDAYEGLKFLVIFDFNFAIMFIASIIYWVVKRWEKSCL